MAQSSDIGSGRVAITKQRYNNLRDDVLDSAAGHTHSGAADEGKVIDAAATVAAIAASQAEQEAGVITTKACVPAYQALRKIGDGWALGTGGNARGVGAVDLQYGRDGDTEVASGDEAIVGGGYANTASGAQSTVSGGQGNIASGERSTVAGGRSNTASGEFSAICGGRGAVADKVGQQSQSMDSFAADGDAQTSVLVAHIATANATPAELFLDGDVVRCTIAADTTWAFEVLVVARRTDADNESAAYHFRGCIDNNAGTTALVGSVAKTVIAEDSAGWDCDVTADDTNDCLAITVTGEAGKTVRWVARITLVEVTG
jgi:hypothetical protein